GDRLSGRADVGTHLRLSAAEDPDRPARSGGDRHHRAGRRAPVPLVRFGLALPHYDFSLPGERPITTARVVEFAQEAERLGYDSVWISDHFFLSLERYGGPPDRQGSLEPMTTLAALAVQTSRGRLRPLVACAPFR